MRLDCRLCANRILLWNGLRSPLSNSGAKLNNDCSRRWRGACRRYAARFVCAPDHGLMPVANTNSVILARCSGCARILSSFQAWNWNYQTDSKAGFHQDRVTHRTDCPFADLFGFVRNPVRIAVRVTGGPQTTGANAVRDGRAHARGAEWPSRHGAYPQGIPKGGRGVPQGVLRLSGIVEGGRERGSGGGDSGRNGAPVLARRERPACRDRAVRVSAARVSGEQVPGGGAVHHRADL